MEKLRGVRPPDGFFISRLDEMELHGSTSPEEWAKIWEACIPKFNPRCKGKTAIIYGTGGMVLDPYYKDVLIRTVFI